jgi:plasmid stability protein
MAIMAQVLVRNLDVRVVEGLKRKAALHGHSLEQELRDILAESARWSADERVAAARRIRAMTPAGPKQTDSTALIREDRDNR